MSWETVPLGSLITPSPPRRLGSGRELPVLSITMREGLVDQASKFKKRIAGDDLSAYRVVQRGQMVVGFPIDEAVLAFQWIYDAGIVSPAYGIWDVLDEGAVDRKYLERFLRSNHAISFYKSKLRGTTLRRRSLPRAVFEAMRVPLPPLPEQRRIAAILDEADALRAKCANQTYIVEAASDALFDRAIVGAGKAAPLSSIVDLITGPFGSSVHKHDYVEGGIPLINPSHIVGGEVRADPRVAVGAQKSSELNSFALREGDVVLGRRGDMGRTALVRSNDLPALCGTGTMILRSRPGAQVGAYVSRLLRTPRYVSQLTAAASGVTMLNLSQQAVAGVLVPLPTTELETRVAAADARSRELRESIGRRVAKLDALFASLQHRAFRGEL